MEEGCGRLKARFQPPSRPPESLSPTVLFSLAWRAAKPSSILGAQAVFLPEDQPRRGRQRGQWKHFLQQSPSVGGAKASGKEGSGARSPGREDSEPEAGSSICDRTRTVRWVSLSLCRGWRDWKRLLIEKCEIKGMRFFSSVLFSPFRRSTCLIHKRQEIEKKVQITPNHTIGLTVITISGNNQFRSFLVDF